MMAGLTLGADDCKRHDLEGRLCTAGGMRGWRSTTRSLTAFCKSLCPHFVKLRALTSVHSSGVIHLSLHLQL